MVEQVSRNNNLKIPKEIEVVVKNTNSIEDELSSIEAVATAKDQKFQKNRIKKKLEDSNKDTEVISQIPTNANDLMVITVVKKLGAYIITVTEKSPKKFRGVFVVRMQNYCLDTLENLLEANFIRMDSLENKNKRAEFQKQAIIKLKLLGYISMLAEISGCILKRQYKQISIQVAESINLITAWKKSDDARWNNKK